MSNEPGIISLPKGGGGQQGIGEKFAADLFSGTGNFTVPIALPAGRNGLQPQLNLAYSTGNGNSAYGLGWGLGTPSVSRKTSKGLPRYRDGADLGGLDTFVLSGGEDLVPVAGDRLGAVSYRPRTEGLFALIDHIRLDGANHWEVRSTDGFVGIYGTPRPADAAADWQDGAVLSDPADRSKVFSWRLTRTIDPFGNHILYEYERDTGQLGPHHWDQLYLKHIRYVDHGDGVGATDYLISVTLLYEDRPDPFSNYRAGFEIRTRRRCTHIEVHTDADEALLTRRYHLEYLDQLADDAAGALPPNGASLLSRVRVVGHDGERTEELPALDFRYAPFEPGRKDLMPLGGRDLPAQSLGAADLELVDLFGNGLPDLLQMNGSVRFWRNRGDGAFDLPRPMRDAPAGLQLADPGVQLIDADGDGRTDLLVTKPQISGYFPQRFGGLWDRRSFQKHAFAPSFDLEDPEVRLIDLDGDGVTDVIRSGSRLECFFNDPKEGWNRIRTLERRDLDEFPNVSFADSRIRFADLSGDGLQDVAMIHSGNVDYWPNLGHGDWGSRVAMRNSPRLPVDYDPRRILIGDIDGDGLDDIVYVDHCRLLLFINQSGNGWSDPIEIEGTPGITDVDSVRLADMLGTGISGVLWSSERSEAGRANLFFLDFAGDANPYVLREMSNNMGAVTRVSYAPSTSFYLADQARPATRWKTPLPFPVNLVSRVEVIDEVSKGKLTTEYFYHHGYYDGTEKEFRGFGRVDQRDTEVFEEFNAPGLDPDDTFETVEERLFTPPVETRTWFNQGPVGDVFSGFEESDLSPEYWVGDPDRLERSAATTDLLKSLAPQHRRDALRSLRGTVLRTELYARDGGALQDRPFTVMETVFELREEPGSLDDAVRIFYPHAGGQRTTQWERGDDPMTTFSFTESYDPFGQPLEQIEIHCPRQWRDVDQEVPETTPFTATYSVMEFAYSDGDAPYIKDRPAKTTKHEFSQVGTRRLSSLRVDIAAGTALRPFSQELSYYDGDAFAGLPFGQIGSFGVIVRAESLAMTEDILRDAYGPDGLPPYLQPGEPRAWTDEYPLLFQDSLPALAGFTFYDGTGPQLRGYFVTEGSARFDFHDGLDGRGLPIERRDTHGRSTFVEYDGFDLLPVSVIDPAGLTRHVVNDYRVLQAFLSTDANDNRTQFSFTPLGYLEDLAVMGKEGEAAGDSAEVPGKRIEYHLMAFQNSPPDARQPVHVRTIQRDFHVRDDAVPIEERDRTITKVEYSDGFGRSIQTRSQTDDVLFGDPVFGQGVITGDQDVSPQASTGRRRNPTDPVNVEVSGWQVYNNKGQLVRQYEPFFSRGFDFSVPTASQLGQQSEMFYDPRGQLTKSISPDGSTKLVIFGIPRELDRPQDFLPSPWEAYTYDSNDLADDFEGDHGVDSSHWNTPASIEINAMGHAVANVAHLGPAVDDKVVIQSEYDAQGNLVRMTDPLGRVTRYVRQNKGGRVLREESPDGGQRRLVFDALGLEIERRDGKGALVLQLHDEINRPVRLWARDLATLPMTLRQRLVYGDQAGIAQPKERNLNGKLVRHFDEAGLSEKHEYDFKNNLLVQSRRFISDSTIASSMGGAAFTHFQMDWDQEDAETLLDATIHRVDSELDALNRLKRVTYPEDVEGKRRFLVPRYNRRGDLQSLELSTDGLSDARLVVRHVAYDAKGIRTLIAYGNGLMTRYAFEAETTRASRMRTEAYRQEGELDFTPDGGLLQDVGYDYDLTGNVLRIRDRSPGSGLPNTLLGQDALDLKYEYDALYRLVRSSGREHDSRAPSNKPWLDAQTFTSQDVGLTRSYTRRYAYDKAGNVLEAKHQTGNAAANFTRTFDVASASNRMDGFTQDGLTHDHAYDDNGNTVLQTSSRQFHWNHVDQLHGFRIQAGVGPPSIEAVYLHDASGQRVKKVVRRPGGRVSSSSYVGYLYEHHRDGDLENTTIHVSDDRNRIVELRVGDAFPGDGSPALQFHLGDHLGNSTFVTDGDGGSIRREEYYPFGGTSFGSSDKKRYRFTGKEREEESGLSYHGARYYAPWLMRWISADPAGRVDGPNLYRYARNNPISFVDPGGTNPLTPPDDSGDWDWEIGGSELNIVWTKVETIGEKASKSGWLGSAVGKAGGAVKWWAGLHWTAGKKPAEWTAAALGTVWEKTKQYAGNLWGWAQSHKWLAGGAAIGIAALSYIFKKHVWNWVLAPAIRTATNAALGYAIGGTTGAWIGAVTGMVHGLAMAKAGSYNWEGEGWLKFIVDNSWSLFNSAVGSVFATVNIAFNKINEAGSKDTGSLYFDSGWFGNYATTLGNVTVGQQVPVHEKQHALQARIFGPAFYPLALVSFEVNTVLPWWLLFGRNKGDCGGSSFGEYFTGVYRNSWHEIHAYSVEGSKC